jgi:hypothetical protein
MVFIAIFIALLIYFAMKRAFLFAPLFFLIPFWSNGQDYIPFPLENTVWTNGYYELVPIGEIFGYQLLTTSTFYSDGDTLIGGENYFKIMSDDPFHLEDGEPGLIACLRYAEGQVFMVVANGTEEIILYDFTIEEGDSIDDPALSGSGYELIVNDVTYEEIGGTMRKVIQFDGGRWIEGIGNDRGLFWEVGVNISEYWTYQECVSVGGDMIFDHEEGELNCSTLSVDEYEIEYSIYPNPAQTHFTIEGIQGRARLKILDLQGRLIQKEEVSTSSKRISLDHEITSGIYLVKISASTFQSTQRLVIE